jgi:hypothetical protein
VQVKLAATDYWHPFVVLSQATATTAVSNDQKVHKLIEEWNRMMQHVRVENAGSTTQCVIVFKEVTVSVVCMQCVCVVCM